MKIEIDMRGVKVIGLNEGELGSRIEVRDEEIFLNWDSVRLIEDLLFKIRSMQKHVKEFSFYHNQVRK